MKRTVLLKQLALIICVAGCGLINAADHNGATPTNSGAPKLSPEQKELARDDGASAGKRSVAGSGHGVRFEAPGRPSYLTAIRVFGSRYGQPNPPSENAYAWLCDADFKLVSAFPFPYSTFQRGTPQWVTIPVRPTLLPSRFILCVGFNPTATKGVYVHHDGESSSHSLLGLPGREARAFDKGDWLIRPVVQEAAP